MPAAERQYFLPGDEAEAERLDLQHWMLRDGFYVGKELVFAPVDLGKGVNGGKTQVLDSACGTGVWAVELAKQYPETTQFTLVDYNTGPCKHRNPTLPHNAELQQFNLLEDFDKHPEWKEKFDFIHQRLLVFAFPPEQWQTVIKGYFDSLKPGGYIQLEEFEPIQAEMGPHMEKLKDCILKISHPRGIRPETIAKDVESWLKEAGFENVQTDRAYLPTVPSSEIPNEPMPHAVGVWGRNTVTAILIPALKMGVLSQEEHDELLSKLDYAFVNPRSTDKFSMVSFVARKPL